MFSTSAHNSFIEWDTEKEKKNTENRSLFKKKSHFLQFIFTETQIVLQLWFIDL